MATGPVTLADYATISNDPLVFSIIVSLLQNGNVLNDLPLVTKPTLVLNGSRIVGNLPTPNWAALNDTPVVARTSATPYSEQVYIIRNAIDCDIYVAMDQNQIEDPRMFNLRAYLLGLRYDVNDKFVNNNHTTGNLNAPVGLRSRLDNTALYGTNTDMKIDAGAVDMSLAGITAATTINFLETIDTALAYMGDEEGNGVTLYMNDVMKRRFKSAILKLGAGAGFTMTKDAFGRMVEMYRNAKVVDIGRKADQTTRVITSTEGSTGLDGSSVHTSIYAVKYGVDSFVGWQMAPFSAIDLGRISGNPNLRLAIDWAFGWAMNHTRSIARIFGIKVA